MSRIILHRKLEDPYAEGDLKKNIDGKPDNGPAYDTGSNPYDPTDNETEGNGLGDSMVSDDVGAQYERMPKKCELLNSLIPEKQRQMRIILNCRLL